MFGLQMLFDGKLVENLILKMRIMVKRIIQSGYSMEQR